MNIYIVEGHTNYEGFEIVSVHGSYEDAKEKMDSAKKDIDGDIILDGYYDNLHITCHRVIEKEEGES